MRSSPRRLAVLGALCLSLAGVAVWFLRAGVRSRSAPTTGRREPGPAARQADEPPRVVDPEAATGVRDRVGRGRAPGGSAAADLLGRFRSALGSSEPERVRALAAKLRHLLRTDPAARRELLARLQDADENLAVRIELGAIVGTLREAWAQKALLEALAAARSGPPDATAWLVYALGAAKVWPEGEDAVFDGMGNPYVVVTPGGLQLMIDEPLESQAARQALLRVYAGADERGRLAVARALRASTGFDEVRAQLRGAVANEPSGEIRAALGYGLASWATRARASHPEEASETVDMLLGLAARPGDPQLRLVTAASLGSAAWSEVQRDRALAWAEEPGDFSVRYWAIELLDQQLARGDGDAREQVVLSLARIASTDRDAKLREQAVRALAHRPANAQRVLSSLLRVVASDPAWHVRAAAAEALGRVPRSPRVTEALRKVAAGDPDATTRKKALQALQRSR